MIDVQPYLDKLEALKEFIHWKVDTPDKLKYAKATTDRIISFKWALYARLKTITFDEWYNQKQNNQ